MNTDRGPLNEDVFSAPSLVEEKDQQVFFYGLWYVLEFVRADAGWRISRLTQQQAYHHNLP